MEAYGYLARAVKRPTEYIFCSAPGALEVFEISELTSKSVAISWQPQNVMNGILRRYDVWVNLEGLYLPCVARKTFTCASSECPDDTVEQSDKVFAENDYLIYKHIVPIFTGIIVQSVNS